jgi:hypothetical protein
MKTRIWSLFLIVCLLGGIQSIQAEDAAEPVTLTGYFIKRADNTFLQIEMVGVRMIFTLLDENHQKIENVFTRGVMTVDAKGKNKERMVMVPTGDGFTLQSSKTIKKPHLLKVFGRLFKGDDDTVGEPFSVQYNQHMVEKVEVIPTPEK